MTTTSVEPQVGIEPTTARCHKEDARAKARSDSNIAIAPGRVNQAKRARKVRANDNQTTTKVCRRCERRLSISEFAPRVRKGKPSRQTYCQPCRVAQNTEWRAKPDGREKVRASNNASRKRRQKEIRANDALRRAVARGEIQPGPCYAAGPTCAGQIEAHHDDYSRPLDVVWTCRKHHRALDRKRRQARERAA